MAAQSRCAFPCRGGIPICWPQYGKGRLPTHGFLRNCHWSLYDTGVAPDWALDPAPSVSLVCEADAYTYELFPFNFQAMYTVRACGLLERQPLPTGPVDLWYILVSHCVALSKLALHVAKWSGHTTRVLAVCPGKLDTHCMLWRTFGAISHECCLPS